MDEIILRALRGESSPFELERLRRWRAEAPENERSFQEVARIWELSEAGDHPPGDEREMAYLARVVMREAERRRERPPKARRPLSRVRMAGLAGGILVAGLASLLVVAELDHRSPLPHEPSTIVLASASAPQTLQLDDGSFVRLAAGSRLEVEFRSDSREARLQGRAFFAVAPDSLRPFLVRTSDGQVRVLGTRFEVSNEAGTLRAVVVEGRVELASSLGVVEVPAGSVGRARTGRPPQAEEVDDPWAYLDWPGGLLVFHDTPLEKAIREVEAHFGRPVVLEAEESRGHRISASFQEEEEFDEVVETLCAITGTTCRAAPDGVAILPKEGGER